MTYNFMYVIWYNWLRPRHLMMPGVNMWRIICQTCTFGKFGKSPIIATQSLPIGQDDVNLETSDHVQCDQIFFKNGIYICSYGPCDLVSVLGKNILSFIQLEFHISFKARHWGRSRAL